MKQTQSDSEQLSKMSSSSLRRSAEKHNLPTEKTSRVKKTRTLVELRPSRAKKRTYSEKHKFKDYYDFQLYDLETLSALLQKESELTSKWRRADEVWLLVFFYLDALAVFGRRKEEKRARSENAGNIKCSILFPPFGIKSRSCCRKAIHPGPEAISTASSRPTSNSDAMI